MGDKRYRSGALFAALAFAAAALFFIAAPVLGVGERDFLVRSFSPQGTVAGGAEIKAVFSHEAVSEDVVGRALKAADYPFTFSPPIAGSGKWRDASTFVFIPNGGRLSAATGYTATAKGGLRDREGRPLAGTQSFSFNTPALAFKGAKQTDFDPEGGSASFELEFSLPVSPARLRGYAEVRAAAGRPLNFSITQGPPAKKIRLTVESLSEKDAELRLAAGLPSEAGPLGLEKALAVKLKRSLVMELRDSGATSEMGGGRVWIDTTAPVDLAKAAAFIELSPAAKFTVEPKEGGFAIAGDFKPQERVKVTVKKGLPSAGGKGAAGRALAADWSRAFIFPDIEAQVRFSDPGRVLSPAESMRIPLESVNFDKINVLVWQLYDNNIPIAMRNSWGGYPTDLSRLIADKEYLVKSKPNETARRALDLKPLLAGRRGVFLVAAQGRGPRDWSESRQTINVTDLGLTVKLGQNSAFARVLSVSEAKPLSGVRVTLWSWANQLVGEGRTDREGIAKISLKDTGEKGAPVIALAEKDGDTSYVRFERGLYNGNDDFDTAGSPWLYNGYSAYCYTPRDIFRPGEGVPVQAIVRGTDGRAPKPFPLTMKVFSPNGKLWKTASAKLTDEGVFSARLDIPADAPTGPWNIALFTPGGGDSLGDKEIYVEEFAAPRLFVEAAAKPAAIIGEGDAELAVAGRYTFGTPAAGLPWEAELRTVDRTFTHKDWRAFSFREADKKFTPESSFIASGALDAEGRAKAAVKGGAWNAPSMLDLSIRAGVMDDGGRWTYKTVAVPWYPAAVMAGIDAPREAAPGKPLSFRAAAVATDGKAAALKEMKYSLFRRVRQAVVFERDGRMTKETQEQLIPRGEGAVPLSGGVGAASVTLKEAGEYLLRVETPDGRSRASAVIYVYGASGGEGSSFPDMAEITTDKRIYKAGETAKIKVKSPFAGALLIGAETTEVVWNETRSLRGGKGAADAEFSLKVTKEMRPNAWITAQVVRPAQKDGAPARAFGIAPLAADNGASRLSVEIAKAPRLEPGKNRIALTVKDSAGKGTAADVTVMLVDETVLGLTGYKTPDPWGYFTARRMPGMETYDLYGALITPEKPATPLLTAGGGGMEDGMMMKSSLNPVQARRFKMLSLIKRARADAGGKCEVEFDIPEFSGKARIMAVAATAQAEGGAESATQIGRDVTAEISLPRFAAPGDKFTANVQLFNMTPHELTVKFSARSQKAAAELAIPGGKKSLTVTIKKGSSASVPISYEAKGTGVAKTTYRTEWSGGKGGAIEKTIELPIRPAAPRVTESRSAVIEPGKKLSFSLPEKGKRADFAQGRVTLSAMPQISLAALADFLVTYPYGCFEQTVSAAWPLLVQPELVKHADPALADKEALARRIGKIESMQNYDGGFPRWSGESWSQPWDSLYGTHFLLEAKRMGGKVSPDALKAAVDYARALLPVMPNDDSDAAWRETLTRRAYASFVLTIAGEPPLGWMESLRDKIGEMEPAGRLLLACAYAAAGDKKEAEKITGQKSVPLKEIAGKNANYDSSLRNSALSLLAATYIDPTGAGAAASASGLLKELKDRGRYSTQEGGFSMIALGRWFAAQPRDGAVSGKLIKEPGAKVVGTVNESNRSATAGELGGYRAENNGTARLYAAWSLSRIPAGAIPAKDDGIEIRQRVADRQGKLITKKVTRGEALTAAVTITPKAGSLRGVVAVMPLPAGFEIENPRLTGAGEENAGGVRAEIRDDRLLLFIEELRKPLVWHYSLRAVTEGVFASPQIYAECMYDPGISSVSGGGTITVNAPK
ncbi:MAG: MG2 domain-containing protein [bacterium]|nr:MG2 domain-containing protein [bacterium]